MLVGHGMQELLEISPEDICNQGPIKGKNLNELTATKEDFSENK